MRPTATVRAVAAVLLVLYTTVVVRLTLMPADTEGQVFGLLDRIMLKVSHGRIEWAQTEQLANIALFVPAGFLLAFVVGRAWLAALLTVLASAAIELAQQRYLPSRVPSVRDVELNSLGGIAGALMAWPLLLTLSRSPRQRSPRTARPSAPPAPGPH